MLTVVLYKLNYSIPKVGGRMDVGLVKAHIISKMEVSTKANGAMQHLTVRGK